MKIAMMCLVAIVIGVVQAYGGTILAVPADPLWTDTGIVLVTGSTVTITASGTWWISYETSTGPDGVAWSTHFDEWEHFDATDRGRLVGYIGADPYQGHWGDGTFFPQPSGYISVGSSVVFTAAATGKFWLGINDDAVSKANYDNSGALVAEITVSTTATLPTTWGAIKAIYR
jgi:hypothetical protein